MMPKMDGAEGFEATILFENFRLENFISAFKERG